MSGTKVTTDPESRQAKEEGAGFVASDSLAAESSAYSSSSSVPASSSTVTNVDTSHAKKLDPAAHGADRVAKSTKYPEESGLSSFDGADGPTRHSSGVKPSKEAAAISAYEKAGENLGETETSRAPGGSSGTATEQSDSAKSSAPSEQHSASSSGAQTSFDVDTAPGYVQTQRTVADGKPKGENLKEVEEFEGNQTEDVTEIVDVDSKDNPARVAEQKILNQSAASSGSGAGYRGHLDGGPGPYDALAE